MLNGEADCDKEIVGLERGGGRGGRVREGLGSCNGSSWTMGLVSSEVKEFLFFLTGSGGGEKGELSPFQSCWSSVVSDWWVISTAFESGWMGLVSLLYLSRESVIAIIGASNRSNLENFSLTEAIFLTCGRGRSNLMLGDGGIGGGGRLVGLVDELGREGIGTGRKRGDALGEAGLEGRVGGGGGGGRLEDLRSDEEEADRR